MADAERRNGKEVKVRFKKITVDGVTQTWKDGVDLQQSMHCPNFPFAAISRHESNSVDTPSHPASPVSEISTIEACLPPTNESFNKQKRVSIIFWNLHGFSNLTNVPVELF